MHYMNEQRFSSPKPLPDRVYISAIRNNMDLFKKILFIVLAALVAYCAGSLACRLTGSLALAAATLDHAVFH